jgi:hypothetical protein
MNRTTGARYTAGSFIQTPVGVVAPGDVVTMSIDVLTEVFSDPIVDVYFFVTRSAGGDVQVGAVINTSLTNGVVSRLAITRTCPALTTGAYMIIDGVNSGVSPTNYTALLTEVSPTADSYFDGDTVPGGSWDGTDGLSSSTLTTGSTVTGTATMTLGALNGTATGQRTTSGTATMNLGRLAMTGTNVTGGPITLADDFYGPGPCRPYDYVSFCTIPQGGAAVSGYALEAASEIIYYGTAQRFDTCQVTLRPCRQSCYGDGWPSASYGWYDYGGGGPRPTLINGNWYNIACGQCGTECSCTVISEVMLPGPVREIAQVTVDGVVLVDGVDYRLDDYRKLVRLGGLLWPICNNLQLGITEVGTWSVTAIYGEPLPTLGKLAVGELFCDILSDLLGDDCRIPSQVTDITRQGVSLTYETVQEALAAGFEGLKYVDKFFARYNPNHLMARPYMVDMDGVQPGRVTGTVIT